MTTPTVAHYVWDYPIVPTIGNALDTTTAVEQARLNGTELSAICGALFVPTTDPEGLPLCAACQEAKGTKDTKDEGIYCGDTEAISGLFVGRRIVNTDPATSTLTLDDGTKVQVAPNRGCSCGAGSYWLAHLAETDHIITSAELVWERTGDDDADDEVDRYMGEYRLFVYANNEAVNALTVEGSDGNGYYGTGFHLIVTPV